MPDFGAEELDAFLKNLYEGSKEVSSSHMGLLQLFGLVMEQNQRQNSKDKVHKNVTRKMTNFKELTKIGKCNSVSKKGKIDTENEVGKQSSCVENSIKQESDSDNDIIKDTLEKDDVKIDFNEFKPVENSDTENNARASLLDIEIKEEDPEVHGTDSINFENEIDEEDNVIDEEAKAKRGNLEFDQVRIESDPIWDHVKNIDCTKFNYSKGSVKCNYCGKEIRFSGSHSHIWSIHKIMVERPSRFKKSLIEHKNRKSWIWDYISIDSNNKYRCICQLCNKNLSKISATKHGAKSMK